MGGLSRGQVPREGNQRFALGMTAFIAPFLLMNWYMPLAALLEKGPGNTSQGNDARRGRSHDGSA